jgi:hypothetical protein
LILKALIIPWSQVRVLAGPPSPSEIIILWLEARGLEPPEVSHWRAVRLEAPGEGHGELQKGFSDDSVRYACGTFYLLFILF